MPSKNMLPKGQRHRSVRAEYRATRGVEAPTPPPIPLLDFEDDDADTADTADTVDTAAATDAAAPQPVLRTFLADPAARNLRLDQYLAQAIPDISRARVQLLIENTQVRVDGHPAKPKQKLRGGESIEIEGAPRPEPLHAIPEDIPLDILYEDAHLAVIHKPAGMMVHAGSGSTDDARNRGTLVNALLFHLNKLSGVGGDLRPGIVHRLDKQTSGIILVAKDDSTHRKLGEMFSQRQVTKTYVALVHGNVVKDNTTVNLPIARDLVRRIRMTTRRADGRAAVSHIKVLERITSPYGPFTLVEVRIETGRTHQIRVHMQSLGHPVVGDTLYGAPHDIARHNLAAPPPAASPTRQVLAPTPPGTHAALHLDRNFLHAAHLSFTHPQTRKPMDLHAPLPPELEAFLSALRPPPARSSVE